MLSNLEINRRAGYLYVRYRGDLTREVAEEIIRKTARHGEQFGVRRYLVDLREAVRRVRAREDYNLAYQSAAALGLQPGSLSVLLTNDDEAREWEFVRTVFRNAGYSLEIHTDEAAALAAVTAG